MPSRCRFFNKRGVSPIIATVLLISFAVALGSVVLNWGRNLDISRSEDICSEVSLAIKSIGNAQVCFVGSGANAYINFVLDNSGEVDVNGLGVWIVGKKGTKLLDLDDLSIKKGELLRLEGDAVKYDFDTYGDIKNVQFIPKVLTEDGVDICQSIKADKISACQ